MPSVPEKGTSLLAQTLGGPSGITYEDLKKKEQVQPGSGHRHTP